MSEPIFRLPPFTIDEYFTTLSETVDWGHSFIGVPNAWARSRGKGALVAVLDTGCQSNHPDLNGQVVAAKDFTGSRSGPDDRNSHGTHCCGIVAGIDNDTGIVGVAPEAKLLVGKVLDDSGSGGSNGIAAGIRWAVENGAQVISMSLGSPGPSSVIHAAVKEAVSKGVLVIAAAGNEGTAGTGYPGSHPECVSVGAFDQTGAIAGFSSRGKVDVSAPGVQILSTVPGSKYAKMSGTSMATPYVAGVAALVVGACIASGTVPIPSPEAFKGMLRGCSIDAGKVGKDTTWGWGLVDPAFLIEAGDPKPPPIG
jgi:subtilisin